MKMHQVTSSQINENIREVPGLEGRYMASVDGRIWSMKRNIFRAGSVQSTGYLTITIMDELTKETRTVSIHRLVASAWIDNPDGLPQINHKDGNKINNAVANLEWVTASKNAKHAWDTGLQTFTESMRKTAILNCRNSSVSRRRLSASQLEEARKRIARGEFQKDVAASMGVGAPLLSQAVRGITYKEI